MCIFASCEPIVKRQPVVLPYILLAHTFPPTIGNYSLKNPVAFAFVKVMI